MHLIIAALSGDRVTLNGASYSHSNPGLTAVAGVRVGADGKIYGKGGASYVVQYDWVEPNVNAQHYECRWVSTGDTPDSTPASSGTWIACTSDRTFEETSAGVDTTKSFTLELRRAGTSTILKSVTITLNALGGV